MRTAAVAFAVVTLAGAVRLAAQDSAMAARAARPGTGWLGISMSCSDCQLARRRQDGSRGTEWTFHGGYPALNWLDSDGPAYSAGLRAGDTLVAVDGVDLLTPEGGRALGSLTPGQRIQLTYRRDGRTTRTRVTVGMSPESRMIQTTMEQVRLVSDSMRAVYAARQDQIRQAQREMERAETELARLQSQLQQQHTVQLDSARQRVNEAQRTLAEAMAMQRPFVYRGPKCPPGALNCSGYDYGYGVLAPTIAPPNPPVAATAPTPPAPAVWAWAPRDPVRSISSEDFSGFGRLRYAGRLGANVIEARAPGPINAVEEGDSVIIITSGDMSVRVLLRGGAAPAGAADTAGAPAAAPAPAPRPAPRPARRP